MKIRDLMIVGAAATSMVVGSAASMADEAKPLPAGGPAAQSELSGLAPGTIVEIGGVLFAVTVAGLVAVNADSNSDNVPPAVSTASTSTT
jgi:hypothetical protein